jgi:hypothetical protein
MKKAIEGEFVHIVMFWLKEPNNDSIRTHFETVLNTMIKDSLYIKSIHLGTPAKTRRDIVDNSYTYCYIVTFDSQEDQDKYQNELAHDIFRDAIEGVVDKLVIYDSINK